MKRKKITQKVIIPHKITLKDLAFLIQHTQASVDTLTKKIDSLKEEMIFEFRAIDERFNRIEHRLDKVEHHLDTLNVKFTKDFEKIYTNMINPYEFKSLVLKVENIENSL
jgi:uncharacterized coiled-coil protein SlyX